MNVSVIVNVMIVQRRRCYASVSMNTSAIANMVIVQCRVCCGNITMITSIIVNVTTMQLIADYEKKTQHLWRCSTHNIH